MFIEINNNYYNARFMSGLSETTEEVDNATKYVVVYSFANGDIIKEYFDTQSEADSKFDEVKDTSAGGGGITPTGTISITQNGTVDVTNYASANVSVSAQDITISSGTSSLAGFYAVIPQIPVLKLTGTSCTYMFYGYKGTSIPTLDDSGLQSKIKSLSYMFSLSNTIQRVDLTSLDLSEVNNMSYTFNGCNAISYIDISNIDVTQLSSRGNMFNNCGSQATVANGAYAAGIPYVYVKDKACQTWVLTDEYAVAPSTWSTDNVVIKNSNN